MFHSDRVSLEVLRAIKATFTNWEKANPGTELTEAEEVKLMLKMKAQREDSINQYKAAGRMDLVEQEMAELRVLNAYIPVQPSDDEIKAYAESVCDHLIAENGGLSMKDMRQVMSVVRGKFPTASGRIISDVVKSKIE